MKKFKFSVIIPVYNVEEYLEETIESVINQTIGFEDNIQLVLINDGSPDNSEEICLEFKDKYPENIIYYKQENAGVSAARNKGITLAEGELVNFLDSDDKWSLNAFDEVWNHYIKNRDICVISTKMRYFDGKNSAHILNYKYKENKIVDIKEDYEYIQLSTCSCFIKNEVIKNYKYDLSIRNEEDTKLISEILLDHTQMLVLNKPIYYYRKRPDNSSASQTSPTSKLWYTVTPKKVYLYLFEESRKRFGEVLGYFKYLIAYNILWRITYPVADGLMSDKEKQEYIDIITNLIKEVDLKYFVEQKNFYPTNGLFIIKTKLDLKPADLLEQNNNVISIKNNDYPNADIMFAKIDDIFISKGKINIVGRINEAIFNPERIRIKINGKLHKLEYYKPRHNSDEQAYNDEYISRYIGVKCQIDINEAKEFGFVYDNKNYLSLGFSNTCVLTNKLEGSYYKYKNKIITYDNGKFTVSRKMLWKCFIRECKNIKGLISIKKYRILAVRMFIKLSKLLPYRHVWLLSDRVNMADDNAEHLFKYIIDNKPKKVNAYYVLNKDSKDFERLKKIGKVVDNNSLKYKILFHNADYIISSHAETYITNIYGNSNQYYSDLFHFKYVFLQHGITKNDISPWLNPNTKHIDMFVSAAKLEYEGLKVAGYNDGVIQLTGFPRYDGLMWKSEKYKPQKTIMISFTWRSKLVNKINRKTGKRVYNKDFKKSSYYQWFNSILNNKKLLKTLDKEGYRIRLLPHPNLIAQMGDFEIDSKYIDVVTNVNYQKEFCENKILVTDSSSIFFDFAYLKKPVIYYQPDNKELYESQIYDEGYFDCNTMGFGPVLETEEEAVDAIIKAVKNDGKLDKKYEERVNSFFTFTDANNCKRVIDAIKKC